MDGIVSRMHELIDSAIEQMGLNPHSAFFEGTERMLYIDVAANVLIALAYFSIPIALVYFVRKRKDLAFNWMFKLFAAFIFACGLTHLTHAIMFFYPVHWFQTATDVVTAAISIASAIALWYVIPAVLKIPTPAAYLEAKEEVRVKERELQLHKEMEERRSEFISVASHELKTPVTSLKLFVEVLMELSRKNNHTEYDQYLTKVNEQTDKLASLIRELLDVARIEGHKLSINKDVIDLNLTMRTWIEEIQRLAGRHTLILEGRADHKVCADVNRLEQVVSNLVSNAIKYSPNSNRVIIRLSEKDGEAQVSVQDFGIGISEEHIAKIFERFFRVSGSDERTYPGMGVGLYLSHEIIKNHGGRMWVKSVKGKGSKFFFSLPLVDQTS